VDLRGARWLKSSRSSGGGSGDCVEVAVADGHVSVRDSKSPDGPTLVFTLSEWRAFLEGAKANEFDV
jgi:hypothetical protein